MSNEIKIEKRLIESAPGSFIFEFDNEIINLEIFNEDDY